VRVSFRSPIGCAPRPPRVAERSTRHAQSAEGTAGDEREPEATDGAYAGGPPVEAVVADLDDYRGRLACLTLLGRSDRRDKRDGDEADGRSTECSLHAGSTSRRRLASA
jgi:hypothetical protein